MKCLKSLAPFVVIWIALAAYQVQANSISPGKAVDTICEVTKRAWNKPCLTNANCYKSFFDLENYCCVVVCCNFVEYIGMDK